MSKTSRSLVIVLSLVCGLCIAWLAAAGRPRDVHADPVVLYAAPAAAGTGDCSTWTDACTLQTALGGALSGDEIWVQAGIHTPGVNRTDAFSLKNGVALYGGFAGTETLRTQRDWQANVTVLSADIDHNDITDAHGVVTSTANITGSNACQVTLASGVDSSAVLDGFSITAAWATCQYPGFVGGGMYLSSSSPTLANLTFSGNYAYYGGGMYLSSSSPALRSVLFAGNVGEYNGGGMVNYDACNPTLADVAFIGNSSPSGDAGGMWNYLNTPVLTNALFSGNTSSWRGGAMYNGSSNPKLTNVAFYSNSAPNGGGMYNHSSTVRLAGATFHDNRASSDGGAINNYNSNLTLVNCVLWGDGAPNGSEIYGSSAAITFCDVQGGWEGTGNIDTDPLFVDAAHGDLRLQAYSPAIDAGDNAGVPAGITTDLDGASRFKDMPNIPDTGSGTPPIVDMGAYEVQVDTIPPMVLSIIRADPSPTLAASVAFTITFSEVVTGVDSADLSLNTTGSLTGTAVTAVAGTGTALTVTVSTGTGHGLLRLVVSDTATIDDLAGNPLAGLPFTDGEAYAVRPPTAFLPLVLNDPEPATE